MKKLLRYELIVGLLLGALIVLFGQRLRGTDNRAIRFATEIDPSAQCDDWGKGRGSSDADSGLCKMTGYLVWCVATSDHKPDCQALADIRAKPISNQAPTGIGGGSALGSAAPTSAPTAGSGSGSGSAGSGAGSGSAAGSAARPTPSAGSAAKPSTTP